MENRMERKDFLTIQHAMSVLDKPMRVERDPDERVIDDHRWVHVWATNKPGTLVEELKKRGHSFEEGLRKLHEIYVRELRRRKFDHESTLNFEIPTIERLQQKIQPFLWKEGAIQWVGSAVKGKERPNDIDVVVKLGAFDQDFLRAFGSQFSDEDRKKLEFIWTPDGSKGPFINAGDFWFHPSEETKIVIPEYKLGSIKPVLPIKPGFKYFSTDLLLLRDRGLFIELMSKGKRLIVERRHADLAAFDIEGSEVELPENLQRDIMSIKDPPSFFIDGFWNEEENKFYISDILWWRETEVIDFPTSHRYAFLEKFPRTQIIDVVPSVWCYDSDEIAEFIRSAKPKVGDKFLVKTSESRYVLSGESPDWYEIEIPETIIKGGASSDERIKELVDSDKWEAMKADARAELLYKRDRLEPLYPFQPLKTAKRGYHLLEIFGLKPLKALIDIWFKVPNKVAVETKFDAYRVNIHKKGDRVAIYTESGINLAGILPKTVEDVKKLKCDSCILDSEHVPYDEEGNALGRRAAAKAFGGREVIDDSNWVAHIFDILFLDGKDLHDVSYEERRKILRGLELPVKDIPEIPPKFHLQENIVDWATTGEMMEKLTKEHSAVKFSEGAMYKQAISKYPLSGVSPLWAKMKKAFEIDALVVGRKPKRSTKTGKPLPGQWTFVGAIGPVKPVEANPKIRDSPIEEASLADYVRYKGKIYTVLGDTFASAEDANVGDILRVMVDKIRKLSTTRFHWLIPKVSEKREDKTRPDPLTVAEEIARESGKGQLKDEIKKGALPLESRMEASSRIAPKDPKRFVGGFVDGEWYYAHVKSHQGVVDFMKKHGISDYISRDISWDLHEFLYEKGINVVLTEKETARDALDLWTYVDQEEQFPMKAEFSLWDLKRFLSENPSLFSHSRYECMYCKKPPTIEVLWAEGMAHAWFCDKHFEEWKREPGGPWTEKDPQYDPNYTHESDIVKVRRIEGVASKKFQSAQYMVNPDESKIYRFVAQAHVRGLSVHIDIRFVTELRRKLIGWTMDALKSLIKPMLRRYVDDRKLAEFNLTRNEVHNMTIKEISLKLNSTTAGKKFYDELSLKAEDIPDSVIKGMVNQLVREELMPILEAPERKILLQVKEEEPYEWLEFEGRVPPGEVGATAERTGRFFIIDSGIIEFGAQKSYYHEYWLHGKVFKEHFIVRRLPTAPKWELKESFAWMGFFALPEKLPYTITKRAIEKRYMPPVNCSALPKVIRAQIPNEYKYWIKKDAKEAKEVRNLLVQAIKRKQVKLKYVAGLKFAIKRFWWRGPLHVRGVPNIFYYLIFHDGKRVVKAWDLGGESPFELETVTARFGRTKDKKMILKTTTFPGKHILNPNEELPLNMDTSDEGSMQLIADSPNFMRFKLSGGILKGLFVIYRESPDSVEWFFKKAELPEPIKKGLFGAYSGLVSIQTEKMETKELDDLLIISGPFLRPGEMIGLDMRPSYFPPESIRVLTPTMVGQPLVAMHGDLKGDVVGHVHKVSIRKMPVPEKPNETQDVGYCEVGIVWHPKAIQLILSKALPDFSIEVLPKSVWDSQNQREIVLGGKCVGLGLVTRGAGKDLHIAEGKLVKPSYLVKKEYKLTSKFGIPIAKYLRERYWGKDESSTVELAREFRVSETAIKKMFASFKIPTRNLQEAASSRRAKEATEKKFGAIMNFVFLGTGAEETLPREEDVDPQCIEARKGGRSRRNQSSLLLTYGGKTLLIDAPEQIVEMLSLRKVLPENVLITHAHPDHSKGLNFFTNSNINVFATKETWSNLRPGTLPPFKKRIVSSGTSFRLHDFVITPFRIAHSSIAPAVCYKVRMGERSFVYAPDVLDIPEKAKVLKGVDIYVGDGSSLTRSIVRTDKQGRKVGHASMKEQIRWCNKEGISEILFTHIGHVELPHVKLNEELRKVAPNATAMYDGASFMLTDENPGHKLPEGHARLLWEGKKRIIVSTKPYMKYATRVILFLDEHLVYGRMVEGFPEGPFSADQTRTRLRDFHRITDSQWKKWFKDAKQVYIYRPRIISRFVEPIEYRSEQGQQVYIRNVRMIPRRDKA